MSSSRARTYAYAMGNQRVVGFKARSNTAARARRKQPADVDALGYRAPDAGLDQPFLFAVPEEPVLHCVRVDTADTDARPRDAGAHERVVREPDDGVDAFWRDALDRIN